MTRKWRKIGGGAGITVQRDLGGQVAEGDRMCRTTACPGAVARQEAVALQKLKDQPLTSSVVRRTERHSRSRCKYRQAEGRQRKNLKAELIAVHFH